MKFRDEIMQRFKDYLKNRTNGTDEQTTSALDLVHKKLTEKKLETLKEGKRHLVNKLDNVLDRTEKIAGHMQKAIDRAQEKGHDTSKLSFLLQEYNTAIDNAKVFFDDGHYKDAIASLQDAKQTFKEFKQTFADIVKANKEGKHYTEETGEEMPPAVNNIEGG